jgi:hypothetical protein
MSTKQKRAKLIDLHRKIFELPIGFNVHDQTEGNMGTILLSGKRIVPYHA